MVGGALAGIVGGGVIGHIFHKGLRLTDEDIAQISEELNAGRAMDGVLAWDTDMEALTGLLVELGGKPRTIRETNWSRPTSLFNRRDGDVPG